MSAYLIGNLLGRLLISYLIVWVVMWLVFSHRRWRDAFRMTRRWYGIASVGIVFVVGVLAGASRGHI